MEKFLFHNKMIRNIISFFISESPMVCEIIEDLKGKKPRFIIQINKDGQSWANIKDNLIILGIGNIQSIYDICNAFCKENEMAFDNANLTDNKNIKKIDVCIENNITDSDIFQILTFLYKGYSKSAKVLTLYAMAFTLFHEFGHIKNDNESNFPITNEKDADQFAFECIERICSSDLCKDYSISLFVLGALMELLFILKNSKFDDSLVNQSHPHPVTRIYNLLDFFSIEDESYLWSYSYEMIIQWMKHNNRIVSFEQESSISPKEKLKDAYLFFKNAKNIQSKINISNTI